METVEILVMNLAFQDLVGTLHQELERKTSVMVDVRTRLVLEYIRIRKSTYVPLYTDTKFVNRIKRWLTKLWSWDIVCGCWKVILINILNVPVKLWLQFKFLMERSTLIDVNSPRCSSLQFWWVWLLLSLSPRVYTWFFGQTNVYDTYTPTSQATKLEVTISMKTHHHYIKTTTPTKCNI